MDEFSINDNSFNDYKEFAEFFQYVQNSYAETYGEEASHVVQDDKDESYDEAYNNFQERVLSYTGSHNKDYKSNQNNNLSYINTESHKED
ncbi:8984_t:CDS:2 [Dentiscutata erythropus]|uniref:8984_t:CDS:1 n=1 Tax=Dentiscutata erythropus TaxID=1348616 RepID=A0A9N8Z1V6_9GLOM|nr:8984_t:CDS:2 [Dentiscutata erythropus]